MQEPFSLSWPVLLCSQEPHLERSPRRGLQTISNGTCSLKKCIKTVPRRLTAALYIPTSGHLHPFQLENTFRLHCVILKWSNKAKKKIIRIRWESVVKTHYVLPARENAYHTLVIDFHSESNWWRGWRAQNVKTNKKARLGYIWLVDKRE